MRGFWMVWAGSVIPFCNTVAVSAAGGQAGRGGAVPPRGAGRGGAAWRGVCLGWDRAGVGAGKGYAVSLPPPI